MRVRPVQVRLLTWQFPVVVALPCLAAGSVDPC